MIRVLLCLYRYPKRYASHLACVVPRLDSSILMHYTTTQHSAVGTLYTSCLASTRHITTRVGANMCITSSSHVKLKHITLSIKHYP